MLKEEKELRTAIKDGHNKIAMNARITALVRAVREDAAKNVKAEWNAYFTSERDCDIVCAAIRSKK